MAARRIPPAFALLLWCALGTVLAQLVLARAAPNPQGFSPIFWYLLDAYDTHGNLLLVAIAVAAFLLRRQPAVASLLRVATDHPWRVAAIALPLLCAGAATVYRGYPLSMDEYVPAFQAGAFASGKLAGRFPAELIDQLLPRFPLNHFFLASRATGEVSGSYLPGFALLLAPFTWLGIPWAANPVISALTLPALHRLTREISGSREAAGWAVALTAASPVFVVSAVSFYSTPAHLLCSVLYALLLLRPTVVRALLAGLVGSLALTLHNPAPHLLFALAFLAWLALRRTPLAVFAALLAGYVPLLVLLGYGWQQHLAAIAVQTGTTAAAAPQGTPLTLGIPTARVLEARLAGLSKVWTWGSAGLMVLAAYGYAAARARAEVKVLAAALAITFIGYFLVPFDQGHGWGYRYLHAAWFVLPLLAGVALTDASTDAEFRNLAGWAVLLSLVFANALRLSQVDAFMTQHFNQVPPLARPADAVRAEIVFVDPGAGFYTRDMVRNDPFLRQSRTTMVYDGRERTAALMAQRFPDYTRRAEGKWGELWTR